MKKSQTATEYLIILAVVIVIALIVVGVLGGIPSIGTGTTTRTSDAKLSTSDVAIISYAVTDTGTKVTLRNNNANTIRVSTISINNTVCVTEDLATTLNVGETRTITCSNIRGPTGNSYSYPVNITWSDSSNTAYIAQEKIAGKVATAINTTTNQTTNTTPDPCENISVGQECTDGSKVAGYELTGSYPNIVDDPTRIIIIASFATETTANSTQAEVICDATDTYDWTLPNNEEWHTLWINLGLSSSPQYNLGYWSADISNGNPTNRNYVTFYPTFSTSVESTEGYQRKVICMRVLSNSTSN